MSHKNTKKRIFYYDFLRCIAIIFIIACHVFAIYVNKKSIFGTNLWLFSMYFNTLRDVGVPLFVAISGALLLNRRETIGKFVKKRLTRVVIPYIFWAVMFFFFVLICVKFNLHYPKNITAASLLPCVFNINPQAPAVYLWFVPMILIVYIFVFIINKINEKYPSVFKIALILSIISIILLNLDIISVKKPFTYPFFTCFAVFGYYLANTDFTVKKLRINENKLTVIFFVLTIVIYTVQVLINASMSISSKSFTHLDQFSIVNIATLISLFLFARYFSESTGIFKRAYDKIESSKLGEAIFSISITSYGIYLVHMIILALLKIYTKHWDKVIGNAGYAITLLVLTVVISWIIVLVLDRIPYVRYISGAG